MKTIVWICDCKGWAFNNLANTISGVLDKYEHKIIFPKFDKTTEQWYFSQDDLSWVNSSDVIILMTPAMTRFLNPKLLKKCVVRISGNRRFIE